MSMIGRELFTKSEYWLWEIFGTRKEFGGLHVITVGDFFQMCPVRDSYVFKDNENEYGPLSTNLWKCFFYVYSLTEVMRQREERQFCEVLNRLCIGELTEDDHRIFMSRIVEKSDPQYASNARHFFPLKIQCKRTQ